MGRIVGEFGWVVVDLSRVFGRRSRDSSVLWSVGELGLNAMYFSVIGRSYSDGAARRQSLVC